MDYCELSDRYGRTVLLKRARRCMLGIPPLRRLKQEDFKLGIFLNYTEFQASFIFVTSLYLKIRGWGEKND